jgi:signal transduction histidine kinase
VQTPATHKGKGKGVNLDTDGFGPPILPQNVTEPPWLAAMSTLATAAPPPSQATPEDRQLKTILAALKKHNDVLPPELQNMVNDAAIKEGQQQTKQLHAVVTAHGKARKELQQAQLARYNLHNAWRSFLSQAVTQWQGYSAQFMEQEKQMNERVIAAQTALDQAKENLATAKASAGIEAKDDNMNVSDEEQDKDLTGTASHRIQEGLTSLQTNLEALQQSATQMLEDEQKALKRPRIEEKQDHGTKPSEPSAAVPGFG